MRVGDEELKSLADIAGDRILSALRELQRARAAAKPLMVDTSTPYATYAEGWNAAMGAVRQAMEADDGK
jgi:hypothetical protein